VFFCWESKISYICNPFYAEVSFQRAQKTNHKAIKQRKYQASWQRKAAEFR
jgi:hypothetical protein